MKVFFVGLLALVLAGCSEPDVKFQIPVQKWEDTVIEVQTRPTPARPGMNEFLILATLERGKPVHNLVISLRGDESHAWQQAIQDGHSGVYRKAVNIPESSHHLYVKLRKKRSEEQREMIFDLRPRDVAESQ